jgi:hypothetical protein
MGPGLEGNVVDAHGFFAALLHNWRFINYNTFLNESMSQLCSVPTHLCGALRA